ncbi:unnamed protein product, partial [Amoebophrya sp. A25]
HGTRTTGTEDDNNSSGVVVKPFPLGFEQLWWTSLGGYLRSHVSASVRGNFFPDDVKVSLIAGFDDCSSCVKQVADQVYEYLDFKIDFFEADRRIIPVAERQREPSPAATAFGASRRAPSAGASSFGEERRRPESTTTSSTFSKRRNYSWCTTLTSIAEPREHARRPLLSVTARFEADRDNRYPNGQLRQSTFRKLRISNHG